MTHNCWFQHMSCPKCSKFVKCVGRKSSDTNWFGQAAQQVADHGVLGDL